MKIHPIEHEMHVPFSDAFTKRLHSATERLTPEGFSAASIVRILIDFILVLGSKKFVFVIMFFFGHTICCTLFTDSNMIFSSEETARILSKSILIVEDVKIHLFRFLLRT
jgi:hypothetical protein